MALKVWLPLIKNINNQGVDIQNPMNSGAVVSTSNPGPLGGSFLFNGTSNRIITSYKCQEAAYTVCMWVYFTKFTVHLLDMRNSDGSGYQPMYVTQTQTQVGGGDGVFIYIPASLSLNTWYHMCVTADSTETSLYINGVLTGSTTGTKAINLNKILDIHIGSRYSGASWFGGNICDFRLYNECLTPYQVKEIAKGLVLHYRYLHPDYPSSVVVDSSGYGRNGIVYGDAGAIEDSPDHRYGFGMTVGATANDYIQTVSPSAGVKTVSFWIRSPKTASTVAFADYKSHLGFGFNGSGLIIVSAGSSSNSYPMFSSQKFKANSWNFIVIRYNSAGNDIELFINGEQETTRSSSNYWTHSTDTLMIGRRSTGTNMSCQISDFRMYATRLIDEDILNLYHTSLKLFPNGKDSPFELYETNTNKIQVPFTGVLTGNSFVESNVGNKFKSTQVISNEFIER
jgi:hypothetical protein